METPFASVNVVLLGPKPDERLFSEVEAQVQSLPWFLLLVAPIALMRFLLLPADPPLKTFEQYEARPPTGGK